MLAAGHGETRDDLVSWLRREGLWDDVTTAESEFLLSDSPTQQQRLQGQWRAEALVPLLWGLRLIPEMAAPQGICDVELLRSVLPPLYGPTAEFISSAELRGDAEIYEAYEVIYQIHWQIRDALFRHQPTSPGKLPRMPHPEPDPPAESYNAAVVQERHHAFNWLIGYRKQEWDRITTDT